MQSLQALIGWVREAGANRVEHGHGFDLAAISLLVDHNGGVNVGSVFPPVGDLLVNESVVGVLFSPSRLRDVVEALLNALLSLFEVQLEELVGTLGAGLVDDGSARVVHPRNVLPPVNCRIARLHTFVETDLTEVLQDDLAALLVLVGRLNSAVLSAAEAIRVQVLLVAVCALPEDIAWLEVDEVAEVLLNFCEVFEEVDGSIRRGGEPEVDVDDVVLGHDEFTH